MEARPATALSDATPTGSETQIITPDGIPEQVIEMSSHYIVSSWVKYNEKAILRMQSVR